MDFMRRKIKREREGFAPCARQITKDCKAMLRNKIEQINLFNSTYHNNSGTTPVFIALRRAMSRNPTRQNSVKIDDPNITIEEYIRLEEEKARRHGKVYNWETATYGKIWYDEDVHDLRSVETKFPAIVFNDSLTSNETPSCEPTLSSLNNEIEFRISFDESDDEDYTVVFDKNSFSYKIFSTNDLKTYSENDNEKDNKPLFPSPKPTVSYFDALDFFNDFENEFPAFVYNDSLITVYMAFSLNEYSVYDTGINTVYPGDLGSKEISANIGREFTNLEILKCWSLETSRPTTPSYTSIRDPIHKFEPRDGCWIGQHPLLVGPISKEVCYWEEERGSYLRWIICAEFGDTWAWVPARPARQEGDAGGVAKEALVAPGGGDEDEEMPQVVPPPPRTQGERIVILEEEDLADSKEIDEVGEVSIIWNLMSDCSRDEHVYRKNGTKKIDDPNITMEEYIRLQEEKALSHGEAFNWQTATYGKMEYYKEEDDCFTNFESKFPAIVLDDTSREALSWEPTISPLNDNEIDFRISFDEFDDEDYTTLLKQRICVYILKRTLFENTSGHACA
ncbi:hypothetical protein Tco_1123988 [Tanacetum coccineum]|uniref:Uncharacterized protein n=1 Tax=Tanacetum coccineum TaxID=301880 RepID=A0ABQ5J7P4_9ASTR